MSAGGVKRNTVQLVAPRKNFPVIPAKAGIQTAVAATAGGFLWIRPWIPAFAGMTVMD